MNAIEKLRADYAGWLHQKPAPLHDDATGWSVVPTPFVGLFGDLIELFVKEDGDSITLSDDGLTLWNAESAGLDIHADDTVRLLDFIFRKYDITRGDDLNLCKSVDADHFDQGRHDMSMAMLAINDLASKGGSVFQRNVRQLMLSSAVNALPQIQIKGRSGIDFTFDYIVPRPKAEYLVQSVGSLDSNVLASFILGIDEVKDFRRLASGKVAKGLVIVNDVDKPVRQEYLRALTDRQLEYVLWSRRSESKSWADIYSQSTHKVSDTL